MGTGNQLTANVGIVVPTLGTRPEFLIQNLESIRSAGSAHITIVAPQGFNYKELVRRELCDSFVVDPKLGLAEAINVGIASLPKKVEFINWLGDDDVLAPDSLDIARDLLGQNPSVVGVFGRCAYIDEQGHQIWENRSGQWASWILRFGPDLIPQPGSLYRREAFEKIGGLRPEFGWAFDFDMYIRLAKIGKLKYIPKVLASFRWHADSLTVATRNKSVAEASAVRKAHLPKYLLTVSELWEFPLRKVTLWAGALPSTGNKKI